MTCTGSAVYIWFAFLLLVLPLDWMLAAVSAALIHELSHLAVLLLLGGSLRSVSVSGTGCVMESTVWGNWRAVCSILAGPVASLALLLLSETFPKLAVCGLFHGLYNLIPVLPLDGGRILQLMLHRFCPDAADRILFRTGCIVCAVILVCSAVLTFRFHLGALPMVASVVGGIRLLQEKYLANRGKSGYNSLNFL